MRFCRHATIALLLALLLGSFLWGMTVFADPGQLFVSPDGSGEACTQAQPCALPTALAKARDGDVIIVAEGRYTGEGDAVIDLAKSVTLLGGWDGSPSGGVKINPSQHPSVLDGENQRRVAFLHGKGVSVRIEGFVIEFGNATNVSFNSGYGGGIYTFMATPAIVNNTIAYNVADGGAPPIGGGGGICIVSPAGRAVIAGNTIISNTASLDSVSSGGGMYVLNAPNAQISGNEISANVASRASIRGAGGGLAVTNSAGAKVIGNYVDQNKGLVQGDGAGKGYGGGIFVAGAKVSVSGNSVLFNTAIITGGIGHGGGMAINAAPDVIISNNWLLNNIAQANDTARNGSQGGGVYCFTSDRIIIGGNRIAENIVSASANGSGGGIHLQRCDQGKIVSNWITDNWGSKQGVNGFGGGLSASFVQGLQIESNRFLDNRASERLYGYGGGLYIDSDTTFTMTNNIVARNIANSHGGGMAFASGPSQPVTGTLLHNTFVANNGGNTANGRIAIDIDQAHVDLTLVNNIIAIQEHGVYVARGSRATLHNTLFYANLAGAVAGPGDIENHDALMGRDPLLTADYHLRPGSPAIDAGMDAGVNVDIDGQPRPLGAAPDIGADEYYQRRLFFPRIVCQ